MDEWDTDKSNPRLTGAADADGSVMTSTSPLGKRGVSGTWAGINKQERRRVRRERVTSHADTVALMFQYVIHWQDSDRAPEAVLADRFEDEGDEYVFYTSLESGEEQRRAIRMSEVKIVTLEGQEGV